MRHVVGMHHFELLTHSCHLGTSHGSKTTSLQHHHLVRQRPAGVRSRAPSSDTLVGTDAWGVRSQLPYALLRSRKTSYTTYATDGDRYIDLPEPKRRTVALPRILNSAGKIFTFAGLLKVLVVAHGAVPWSAVSGWEAIANMAPFGIALVLVARFLLQINFMQRRGSMFLLLSMAALLIAAQAKLAPRARKEAAMQPVRVASMQRDKPSQHRPLPSAEDAEQIWDRAEKRALDMQAATRQNAAKSK